MAGSHVTALLAGHRNAVQPGKGTGAAVQLIHADPLDANTACRGKDALSMLPDAQNVKEDLEQVQGCNFSRSSNHQTACPNLEDLRILWNVLESHHIRFSQIIFVLHCFAMFWSLAMFSFPSCQASLLVNELVAVRDSAKAASKNDGIDEIVKLLLLRTKTAGRQLLKNSSAFWR